MTVFLNGRFVPEHAASVSVFDRAFLYGDGLFETMRVVNGRPFRWAQHLARLERGAGFLGISLPFTRNDMAGFVAELVAQNRMPDSILRITLSRGTGARGYSPRGADKPTLVMTLHPMRMAGTEPSQIGCSEATPGVPLRWRARTSSFRLPSGEVLAQYKTSNKLVQVLARAEAEAAGADEALLLNNDGFVVEAASGNLFFIERAAVCTPPLTSGILPGVTREVVRELCAKLKVPCRESCIQTAELARADAAFLSLSSHGIVELTQVDDVKFGGSPIIGRLYQAYLVQVGAECG